MAMLRAATREGVIFFLENCAFLVGTALCWFMDEYACIVVPAHDTIKMAPYGTLPTCIVLVDR